MAEQLRILVIGAHPDDCELKAGGTCALYRQLGHAVKFVSVTRGNAGHQSIDPVTLADMRLNEARSVAALMGYEYEILPFDDGRLEPTLAAREAIIRLIRQYRPDLILSHRPNDYHPDHRATSLLVCDAAYMVIVPHIVPDVPALRINPVIAYLSDNFTRPAPFTPSVVVDIDPVLDRVLAQLACHDCQFFDWLPYTMCVPAPETAAEKAAFLDRFYAHFNGALADRYRELLIATYGAERGKSIRQIEAFEPCEYGSPLTAAERRRLFPMLP